VADRTDGWVIKEDHHKADYSFFTSYNTSPLTSSYLSNTKHYKVSFFLHCNPKAL